MKKIMVLLAFIAGACSSPEKSSDVLSAEEFKNKIDAGAAVIDVRTPEEYASGHIAGAENIDVKDPSFNEKIGALTMARNYAVYCASGIRSGKAAEIMREKGFNNVYSLRDGIKSWKQRDFPLE